MVWGYVKINISKKLIKIDGTLNSENYITLLKLHLLSDVAEGGLFHHDGSSCYTSHVKRKKSLTDEDITVLIWSTETMSLT